MKTNSIIQATYQVQSAWDLTVICDELEITGADILEYEVKWDQLILTYRDAQGEVQQVELDPDMFTASETDWKRPDQVEVIDLEAV